MAETVRSSVAPSPVSTHGLSNPCLVLNCPREKRFEVILTEMMANTTISEITNEIQGLDDSEYTADTDLDYTRRVTVTNVIVTFVKASNEVSDPLYKNSLIVVSKNETSAASANQYTFTRYW